jgi:hypothetical protein
LAQPVLTIALTALPLAYYVLLGRIDPAWRFAQAASKHTYPLSSIVLELAPLLLPTLLAYRSRPKTFLSAVSMVWPVAAFALFGLSTTQVAATPVHAFQGITIPLSLLAVRGIRDLGLRRLPYSAVIGCVLVAAFTIPTTYWQLANASRMVTPRPTDTRFILNDEHRALQYLARDPLPGGVITRVYLGELVPAETGRHTFVGDCLWSQPHCPARLVSVRRLFTGKMTPAAARKFVVSTHARFLLADCRPTARLDKLLPGIVVAVHRFGCATVYQVS